MALQNNFEQQNWVNLLIFHGQNGVTRSFLQSLCTTLASPFFSSCWTSDVAPQ